MATRAEAAEHIQVSPAYITQLVKKKIIKREDDGSYDLDHVRVRYIMSLRKGQGGGASIPGMQERDDDGKPVEDDRQKKLKEELLSEQIRKIRRENDEAADLLLSIDAHVLIISSIIRAIRPSLETITSRVMRACPDITIQAREIIARQVSRAIQDGVAEACRKVKGLSLE